MVNRLCGRLQGCRRKEQGKPRPCCQTRMTRLQGRAGDLTGSLERLCRPQRYSLTVWEDHFKWRDPSGRAHALAAAAAHPWRASAVI